MAIRKLNLAGMFLLAMAPGWSNAAQTLSPSTQPVLTGRDTPAGAMNVLVAAIDGGDLATTADSFNGSVARRQFAARAAVLTWRFHRVLVARFGDASAQQVFQECQMHLWPIPRHYVETDWQYPPGQPDIAWGKIGPMMQRGDDGIWRVGRIAHPPTTLPHLRGSSNMAGRIATQMKAFQEKQNQEQDRLEQVINDLEQKKLITPAAVIAALYPQGSPTELRRRAEADQKKQEEIQKQQLLAAHFDPSTLDGAIGAFLQAQMRNDRAGLARFFYAEDDVDGRFALANADRIILAQELENRLDKIDPHRSVDPTNHLMGLMDAPEWLGEFQIHGDTATGKSEGNDIVTFRRIGGIWKEDITSRLPARVRTEQMEHDNLLIRRITSDTADGIYKNAVEVQHAFDDAGVKGIDPKTGSE